jgi:hypothetical protein
MCENWLVLRFRRLEGWLSWSIFWKNMPNKMVFKQSPWFSYIYLVFRFMTWFFNLGLLTNLANYSLHSQATPNIIAYIVPIIIQAKSRCLNCEPLPPIWILDYITSSSSFCCKHWALGKPFIHLLSNQASNCCSSQTIKHWIIAFVPSIMLDKSNLTGFKFLKIHVHGDLKFNVLTLWHSNNPSIDIQQAINKTETYRLQ